MEVEKNERRERKTNWIEWLMGPVMYGSGLFAIMINLDNHDFMLVTWVAVALMWFFLANKYKMMYETASDSIADIMQMALDLSRKMTDSMAEKIEELEKLKEQKKDEPIA